MLRLRGRLSKRKAPSFFDPDDARAWTPGIGDHRKWDPKTKRRITSSHLRYDLDGFWFPDSHSESRGDSPHISFSLTFSVQEMVRTSRSSFHSPVAWRSEWFLNGPVDIWLFKRSTFREMKISSRTRRREGVPMRRTKILTFDPIDVQHDTLLHNSRRLKFLVSRVHPSLGPTWGHPLAIEYHEAVDRAVPC
jgi:hypothetical protein